MTNTSTTFCILAALGIAISAGFYKRILKDERIALGLILIVFIYSLLPSLGIPYIIDDVDHLHNLSLSLQAGHLASWLFAPHNEHVIPVIKSFYYLCYTNFWLNPQAFHALIFLAGAGILFFSYKLFNTLTGSPAAAMIGASLLAATNLWDKAIFVITDSHILFCVLLFLVLFYVQYLSFAKSSGRWKPVLFVVTLLLPSTFALGLTSIFFAFVFEKLCIPRALRQKRKSTIPVVAAAWLISLVPYLFAVQQIIHTPHYNDLGKHSVFEIMRVAQAASGVISYLTMELIPNFLSVFSLPLVVIIIFSALIHRAKINWKAIVFFVLFGITHTFIIYTFRVAWGSGMLAVSRYDVFPVVMLAGITAFALAPLLMTKENGSPAFRAAVYLGCFLFLAQGAATRYTKADILYRESAPLMQGFYVQFRNAFIDYFKEQSPDTTVTVNNIPFVVPSVPSLITRAGTPLPMSRYAREPEFFAQYVLPGDIRNRIRWGNATDPAFLNHIRSSSRYEIVAVIIHE